MKAWKKVLLIILAVLLLTVAALTIWQWKNIKAAYTALTREPEKIAQDLEQVRTEYQQTIREEIQVEFTPPSLEQSENLISGVQKPEEVKEELGINATLEQKPPEEPQEQPAQEESKDQPAQPAEPPRPTAKELLERCVAELTACQVDLMGLLGEMKQEVLDEWIALDPAQRTPTKKKELGLAGLAECYELEAVVDDQVREILDRYKTELKAIGADLAPLDTLWDYYEDEKAAQKAYYLNKYLD